MKMETKVLIVGAILLLSVGPLEYFMQAKTQAELPPENNETATSYTLAGNFTAAITKIDPYITYIGVSTRSDISFINSTISGIDEIKNYSIDMRLNPNGNGYQYVINVLENDTGMIPEIGFRLAFRLNEYFFEPTTSMLPVAVATVAMPKEFTVPTSSGPKTITVGENKTLKVLILYNHRLGDGVTVTCSQFTTTTNYRFLKTDKTCLDAEINKEQPYLGLTQTEVLLARVSSKIVDANVTNFETVQFRGTYPYGSNITQALIEDTVEASTAAIVEPQSRITLYGVDAQNFSISGATFDIVDSTTVDVYFSDLDTVLAAIRQSLGRLPTYSLAKGSFAVQLQYASEAAAARAKTQLLSISNITLTDSYKTYTYITPHTLLLEKDYDTYRVNRVLVQFPFDALPGKKQLMLNVTTFYNEILDIKAAAL